MKKETVIAVFCFKRASKLKTCIEALLKNPECPSMEIIFFCDGPRNSADEEGVMATRAYIDSITGFKAVHKQFREKNVSTGPNFRMGLTYLADNYENFIVVEDDLVVSSNYIKYLLDSLAFYKNSPSVFCITGYCFPLNTGAYAYDTVIYKRFCSYGWAGWSDRVRKVIWDHKELNQLRKTSPGFKNRLNKEGHDLYRMLLKQLDGRISTWDIQMQVHVAENKMKVIFPVLSKVDNIGFDSDSTNTFGLNYLKTPIDNGAQRTFRFCPDSEILPELQKQIKKPYGLKALVTRKVINTWIKMTAQVKTAG